MKVSVFEGVSTALITPFDGTRVDYAALKRLIKRQIRLKADSVTVCATTGEAPTLSDSEHKMIIARSVEYAEGKIPIIAGCGSNDTNHAVMMAKFACKVGADGLLMVTPYYNKTTQNGLIAHYFKVADNVDKPIILYNVPCRTGVDIGVETYKKLFSHPNITGVKEASDDLRRLTELSLIDDANVYCGNDDCMLTYFLMGAKGVFSVAANIIPDVIKNIYLLSKGGNAEQAKKLYLKYGNLFKLMFKEVNPIPIKYAMSELNLCRNELRLPLLPMQETAEIDKELNLLAGEISL